MCWQIHVTEVPGKDVDVCHWVGKQRYVIVKFLRRKHCQQVLSMKQDIHKITATDSDLPNNTLKLYWNKSYCPYYRILWSKSKALFTMGNIHSNFISNESVKICLQEQWSSIPITHTADFEKYFPGADLSAPR